MEKEFNGSSCFTDGMFGDLSQLDLLDDNNYTICFNGSLIVNNQESELFSSHIDYKVAIKIDNFIF